MSRVTARERVNRNWSPPAASRLFQPHLVAVTPGGLVTTCKGKSQNEGSVVLYKAWFEFLEAPSSDQGIQEGPSHSVRVPRPHSRTSLSS